MTDRRDNQAHEHPSAIGEGAAGSVAAVVASGLPLEAGLRALSEEAPSRSLRKTFRRMSNELAAGKPVEEVLSSDGSGLTRYVRGLVKAGVQSGQLGRFLEEFLLAVRRRSHARRRFWAALLYPLFVLPLTLLGASFLLAWIVPQFKEIFNDFGVQLPGITMLLISFSDLVTMPVIVGLFVFGPVAVLLFQLLPLMFGRAQWTRLVQKLPVFGMSSRMRGSSEFCSLLGLLVSGGIPLPEALEATGGAMQDFNLREGCRKLAEQVRGGASMVEGALRLPNFSQELRSLFHWESRGKAFGDMLRQAGAVFAARSNVQLGLVGVFVQPLMLLFVGGILGLTVIALFMPLIKLLNELS